MRATINTRRYNLTTNFSLSDIKEIGDLKYEIIGFLSSRFGDTGKKEEKVKYLIKYKNQSSRLWIDKFERL